jgi:hypothetical protein
VSKRFNENITFYPIQDQTQNICLIPGAFHWLVENKIIPEAMDHGMYKHAAETKNAARFSRLLHFMYTSSYLTCAF